MNQEMLNRGHTQEPTELQKAIDQIGMHAISSLVNPIGNLMFCDMHGHYAVPEIQEVKAELGETYEALPAPTCPLCIKHNPQAEGTTATDMEHFIDLKDSLNAATTLL